MIEQSLVHLGLRAKEVLVFLTLARLGCQPASIIAQRSSLNRATTYAILESLMQRGFVSKVFKDKVQSFSAITPRKILELMKVKKLELERQERHLNSVMPSLMGMMTPQLTAPKVTYFEGEEGVKNVMEETLKSTETMLCYCPLEKWLDGPLAYYIRDYVYRRTQILKIPNRVLESDTVQSRTFFYMESPPEFTDLRFIPANIMLSHSEVNIFDNKVAMVSLLPGHMFGVIIESQEIADTQKAIFELAWMAAEVVSRKKPM